MLLVNTVLLFWLLCTKHYTIRLLLWWKIYYHWMCSHKCEMFMLWSPKWWCLKLSPIRQLGILQAPGFFHIHTSCHISNFQRTLPSPIFTIFHLEVCLSSPILASPFHIMWLLMWMSHATAMVSLCHIIYLLLGIYCFSIHVDPAYFHNSTPLKCGGLALSIVIFMKYPNNAMGVVKFILPTTTKTKYP